MILNKKPIGHSANSSVADLVIYDNGDEKTEITGGWWAWHGNTTDNHGKEADRLRCHSPLWSWGNFRTNNMLDLSMYQYIYFSYTTNGSATGYGTQDLYHGYDGSVTPAVYPVTTSGVVLSSPQLLPAQYSVPYNIFCGGGNSGSSVMYVYKIVLTNNPNYPN